MGLPAPNIRLASGDLIIKPAVFNQFVLNRPRILLTSRGVVEYVDINKLVLFLILTYLLHHGRLAVRFLLLLYCVSSFWRHM